MGTGFSPKRCDKSRVREPFIACVRYSGLGKDKQRSKAMSSYVTHSSRPHESILPRPHTDAHHRMRIYGKVRPMEEPSFFERLLSGWR